MDKTDAHEGYTYEGTSQHHRMKGSGTRGEKTDGGVRLTKMPRTNPLLNKNSGPKVPPTIR